MFGSHWESFIKVSDLLDISFIALMIYVAIIWFKKTRTMFVLIGIAISGGIYLFANQFNLILTTQIFQSIFAVIILAIIIIFQQEIRYFFEQIAVWSLNPQLGKKKIRQLKSREVDILAKTLFDLAEQRIGALIVIRGKRIVAGVVDGGVDLDAKLSEHVLKSIFDPHSIGHDGAVIIEGKKLTKLCVHLPLSKNTDQLKYSGTRHAAALGMAEATDALCLVVSEERGKVSVARDGVINQIETSSELIAVLDSFYESLAPPVKNRSWEKSFKRNYREKVLALSVALLLWFVQVYSATVVYTTIETPIHLSGLRDKLVIENKNSENIKLTFTAPRRSFYFIDKSDIRADLDISFLKKGSYSIDISDARLTFPKGFVLRSISPRTLDISIESVDAKKK
ncbi:MAG: DNA integrity scanning protein DisA nucleotide-binding domain protein [Nitrospinae bacterium]|nr:DNA integrity scanning protein DisA nucleotide-binding domain protein [Nitrospinota bacterium]